MKIEEFIHLTSGFLGPISEVQNNCLFHPGKGGKHAKTKENTNLTKE